MQLHRGRGCQKHAFCLRGKLEEERIEPVAFGIRIADGWSPLVRGGELSSSGVVRLVHDNAGPFAFEQALQGFRAVDNEPLGYEADFSGAGEYRISSPRLILVALLVHPSGPVPACARHLQKVPQFHLPLLHQRLRKEREDRLF